MDSNSSTQQNTSLFWVLIFVQLVSVIVCILISILLFNKYNLDQSGFFQNNSFFSSENIQTNTVTLTPTPTTSRFNLLAAQTKNDYSVGNYERMQNNSLLLLENANSDKEKAIAYYWQGLAKYSLKEVDQAETLLNKAITFDTSYAAPFVTLAAISISRQDAQKALKYSQNCVDLDPNYGWCHNNLGLSYILLGQKESGIAELKIAVSLDPSSYAFNDNLKRALAQ